MEFVNNRNCDSYTGWFYIPCIHGSYRIQGLKIIIVKKTKKTCMLFNEVFSYSEFNSVNLIKNRLNRLVRLNFYTIRVKFPEKNRSGRTLPTLTTD